MKNLIYFLFCFIFTLSCSPPKKANSVVSLPGEDEKIFTEVQKQSFQYFYNGAEPTSGLGRERFHADNIYPQNDKNTVTSGGSGFGVMALLVGNRKRFYYKNRRNTTI
jgi:hypothetical protein